MSRRSVIKYDFLYPIPKYEPIRSKKLSFFEDLKCVGIIWWIYWIETQDGQKRWKVQKNREIRGKNEFWTLFVIVKKLKRHSF